MDEGSGSTWWWLAFGGSASAHLFVASSRVAFRMLGPVSIEALVDRIGATRTEFLRKSLRSPSAFWFSLALANAATLLAVLLTLSAGKLRLAGVALYPTGGALQCLGLFGALFVVLAATEFVLPVVLARLDRVAFVERLLPAIRVIHFTFSPLAVLLARWSEEETEDGDDEAGDEEVQAYITVGTREGIIEESEGELLRNLLLFGETLVREVMTPRTDLVGIESTATVRELVDLMSETRYSRIPVLEGGMDAIVGLASLKDAVQALRAERGDERVTTLMSAPFIVPESKRVSELLREMQARRQPTAIVVDEYGGTAGLVTMEDLVEEIVGEIREEHEEGDDVVRAPDGTWLVRGRASLHDVAKAVGMDIDEDQGAATVGGFLMAACARVPAPGEIVERSGYRFAVEEADRRRVLLVRIARMEASEGGEGDRERAQAGGS